MKHNIFYFIILISHILFFKSIAQHQPAHDFKPHHSISLVLSHATVFNGLNTEGKRQVINLPAWGIDYNYQFKPKWSLGIHTDIIIEKFVVEKQGETGTEAALERSYPIAPAIVAMYKINHHWSGLLGAGIEFEKTENFFLNRLGIEYALEMPNEWEFLASFNYDIKWNAYDTYILGVGVAKQF
ncbi:MAG: hypothetical protein JNK61_00165 [Bacteroidia bacterium]|nr:hypothetical protein [Bacteroidia bacterium]HQU99814.1 hypothetical protein [Bacteroidia bacterium]